MNLDALNKVATAMVAPGRGILAADESTGTIAKRFERRLARIQRLIDARSTKALHIEHALTDHIVREASPTLMQTALFDHHVAQEVDRALWHSSRLEKSLEARVSRLRRESDLRIGRPAVEVIFWPYP